MSLYLREQVGSGYRVMERKIKEIKVLQFQMFCIIYNILRLPR